jgi:putative SOS response-associated peptidase YedK
MCGRATLRRDDLGEVARELDAELAADSSSWRPRYNVAPTQKHPLVRHDDGRRTLHLAQWGLRRDQRMHINARAETARHLPAFRGAFAARRCVIPIDGFYEWTTVAGRKWPVWFHRPDGGLLYVAGLWEPTPSGGESFALLTTKPNATVAPIHDRMPVLLDVANVGAWLAEGERRLLVPAPDDWLAVHWVAPRVNSARYDEPDCIAAVGPPPESASLELPLG